MFFEPSRTWLIAWMKDHDRRPVFTVHKCVACTHPRRFLLPSLRPVRGWYLVSGKFTKLLSIADAFADRSYDPLIIGMKPLSHLSPLPFTRLRTSSLRSRPIFTPKPGPTMHHDRRVHQIRQTRQIRFSSNLTCHRTLIGNHHIPIVCLPLLRYS